MARRILHLDGTTTRVGTERRFESELRLEDAVAAHPEVLPSEDLGLGPLIALGRQVDFGAGPIDLLAADPQGRLAIIEFKRGSENPDVRKVVAQLLDYGSSMWRASYEDIERRCAPDDAAIPGYLVGLASARCTTLDIPFDPDAFRVGIEHAADTGDFAFLYVGRDLDERTRRIMTYLAEGPRMSFFGVEVDYYAREVDGIAVLVPRAAFVPTWASETVRSGRASPGATNASPDFQKLVECMDGIALDLGLTVKEGRTGRNYQPAVPEDGVKYVSGIGIYSTGRGAEFNLSIFRELGGDALADELLQRIREVSGESVTAAMWPSVPCETLVRDWARTRRDLVIPYFRGRAALAEGGGQSAEGLLLSHDV
jgi:hypothetical protein